MDHQAFIRDGIRDRNMADRSADDTSSGTPTFLSPCMVANSA